MATATINLEIQPTTGDNSTNVYINGKKRADQAIPVESTISMDRLEASLTTEDDCLEQFMETFLIEVYRCTICRSCYTQKSTIRNHMKLHNLSQENPSIAHRTQPMDPSLADAPKHGLEAAHEQDSYPLNEKEKHSDKKSVTKHFAAAAISNALEVLVGLGTPTLTEGEVQEEKVIEGVRPCNQDKGYHLTAGSQVVETQSSKDNNPSTVQNITENVEIVLQPSMGSQTSLNETTDNIEIVLQPSMGSQTSLNETTDNIEIVLQPSMGPHTSLNETMDNIEIVLQPSMGPQSSLNETTDHPNATFEVPSGLTPEATSLEGLPGLKRTTSIVLSHSSNGEQKDGVDIDGLVRSASESNPDALIITVVTHRGGDKPFEMLQFKKSCKSDAIIPTAQSLGIVSPFPKQTRTSKRKHSCQKCQAKYITEKELRNHIEKKHLRTNTFLCEICGIALATKASVKNHMLAKHSGADEIYQCDQCEYQTRFEKHFRNHVTKHTSKIWCRVCDQTFISTARLKLHCQSPMHTNKVNPLVCSHCDYKTYKKDNLRVHMRKHTGQRPYQCIHCQYASADASTLKKHVMAKHSRIRPHRCQQCGFSSTVKKGLTVHMRKHTGERPFKCNHCDYAAKRQSALTIHRQTHKVQMIDVESPEVASSDSNMVSEQTRSLENHSFVPPNAIESSDI